MFEKLPDDDLTIKRCDLEELLNALTETAYDRGKQNGMNAFNVCHHCGEIVYYNQSVNLIEHKPDCIIELVKVLKNA